MNRHLQFNFSVVLFFCVSWCMNFSAIASSQGIITGEIKDYITDEALEGVTIHVYKRKSETQINGDVHLGTFKKSRRLSQTIKTNAKGQYSVVVNLSENEPNYFVVQVKKEGFETMMNLWVNVGVGEQEVVNFQLVNIMKRRTNDATLLKKQQAYKQVLEQEKIDAPPIPINSLKKKEQFHKRGEEEKRGFRNRNNSTNSYCQYTVPPWVCVQNLHDGYNVCSGVTCGTSSCSSAGCLLISFDEYLAGVVQGELYNAGITEQDALKAQVVAARSFSMSRYENDLAVNCGQAYQSTISAGSLTAAYETSGVIVLYQDEIADTRYSARCNGDYTQSADEGIWNTGVNCTPVGNSYPYLISRPCSGHGNCSGTNETPCCQSTISTTNQTGHIYGHGVGLCQRGTQGLSIQGLSWEEILHRFYTDVCLANTSPDLTAPQLVFPEDFSTLEANNIIFTWGASPAANNYQFQIAFDPDFSDIMIDLETVLTNTTLTGFNNDATLYFWRVRAGNEADWGDYSRTNTFINTIENSNLSPFTPSLVSPTEGSVVYGTSITFLWDEPEGATNYYLELARDETFEDVVFRIDNAESNQLALLGFPDDGTTYHWRVIAWNEAGWSPFSEPSYFTNGEELQIPAVPTLVNPGDGEYVYGPDIIFTWDTVPTATGYYGQLSEDNLFLDPISSYWVGEPSIEYEGFNDDGTAYYWRVRAENAAGWSEYSDPFLFINGDFATSIESINSTETLIVYPNPLNGSKLNISSNTEIEEVLVFNLFGQIVQQYVIPQEKSSSILFNEPAGAYVLQIRFANGTLKTKQLLKL